MSLIQYNGITLPNAYITDFRQDALREESDTDWFITKFDISVQCLINGNYTDILASDLNGVTRNPADIMRTVYSRLMMHRQQLSVKFNGQELIPQRAGVTGFVDAANGPKPQHCSIMQLNNTTFMVQYRIIAHYWENNKINEESPVVENQEGNPVLYNRWVDEVELDEKQYSKRTRSGVFAIRSDNAFGFIADQLRSQMAVVGVPKGFLRERSHYTVSPDGLSMRYTLTDKEQFKMPPPPAFKAQGVYRESTTKTGAVRYGEVQVRLEGSKLTQQHVLAQVAVAVGMKKLRGTARQAGGALIPINESIALLELATIQHDLYENAVEFQARAMLQPKRQRTNGVSSLGQFSTFVPGSDAGNRDVGGLAPNQVNQPPDYTLRGTASLLLQAAAYYDPSLAGTQINPTTGQLNQGREPGTAGRNPE